MNTECNQGRAIHYGKAPSNPVRSIVRAPSVAFSIALATSGLSALTNAQDEQQGIEEMAVFGQQLDVESTTASRLDLTIMETPATVSVISGEAIRERIDTSVMEAVTRSAGFTNEANPGNGGQSIAARGFRGQGSVTKMFDGTNYYTAAGTITFPFDTWSIERIEILKGSSSVLYGEGGIGGAINVISKMPSQQQSGDVRVTIGENNTQFLGVGLTGGITDNLAYRVDYSNNQSDNWIEYGESESEMLSLSLLWNISDDFSLTARYDYGDQQPMKYFGSALVDGDFVDALRGSNFNVGDAEISYQDKALRLKADWAISETASMQTEIYQLQTDRFWKNSEFYSYDADSGLVERYDPLVIGHDMEHMGVRTNFVFDNRTGAGLGLKTSVGFEANHIDFQRPSNFGPANPNPIDWDGDFDIVDANDFDPGTLADLTDALVLPDNESDVQQLAIFGESQIKITDQMALVAGLRYEDVQTDYIRFGQDPIDQSVDALTGRLGLVYDFNDRTVFYGQYSTGATHPSGSLVTTSASNREAEMIKSEQIEIGFKQKLLDDRFQWNMALFDIVKNDLIEDDPDSADPADLIFISEQTSRGIELGASYEINNAWQMYANAAVLNAETDSGETPTYVPEETANIGLSWAATDELKFIADARYVGERFHSSSPIPSYKVVDASAQWNFKDDITLTLKADNLFDELYASAAYYSSTWLVGKPRTLSLTADYSF